MHWMKIDPARAYAGNLSRKVLYDAAEAGDLKVARIGAGRNMLFSDVWLDEWLTAANAKTRKGTEDAENGASRTRSGTAAGPLPMRREAHRACST
jgi:hypothetical protein